MTIADEIRDRMRRQLAGETAYAAITEASAQLAKVKYASPATLYFQLVADVAAELLQLAQLMLEAAGELPRDEKDCGPTVALNAQEAAAE